VIASVPLVYAAIVGVIRDIGAEGIAKDRKNQAQGYNFRGIDDVYNALSPILAKNNLCMLPRVKSRTMHEGQTKSGGTMFYVTCEVDFDLVCATDGSTHTITAFGEAMDSADKATNKAMSAAYKYAAMQAFAIPTEGDNDADAHTPEPARRREEPRRQEPPPARWSDDARKGFCAELGTLSLAYDNVAAYCESLGRPRPSAMTPDARSKLLAHLMTAAGKAAYASFLTTNGDK
jgi:hypothetical protein